MTLQERLVSEAREKYAQDTSPKAHNLLSAEDLEILILYTIEQTIKEVVEVVQTHKEGDESRNECDADGLYCRSGCVHDAVKRIQNFTDTQHALRGIIK
jgi:hypothetical protein